jgi:hypothetical protein
MTPYAYYWLDHPGTLRCQLHRMRHGVRRGFGPISDSERHESVVERYSKERRRLTEEELAKSQQNCIITAWNYYVAPVKHEDRQPILEG